MNRRGALNSIGVLIGGAFLPTSGLLQSCNVANTKRTAITEKDIPLLDEIGETIIPTTATSPGAKAAKIGAYMVMMVNDCYNNTQKNVFIAGLNNFDLACKNQFKTNFLDVEPLQKKTFLGRLDTAAKANQNKQQPEHYFSMIKQLVINGYLSSEVGMTKALRYEMVPGRYNGCVTSVKGDKPWAS